jgi:predicted RNA binding protein YcfA (HicA-like mRNA interferase family)
MNRDVRELVEWAEQNGWRVLRRSKSGHFRLTHTSGATVTISNSPSDGRAMKNAKADMIREAKRARG